MRRNGTSENSVDLSLLPELPASWAWCLASGICKVIASGSTPTPDKMYSGNGEIPFLKVYNLTHDGALDFSIKPTFIDRATHQGILSRSRVLPGDVLINIVGPPLGKVSIVPSDHPEWNVNQAIVLFRPDDRVSNKYLAFALLTNSVIRRITSRAKATAGQHNIGVGMCRSLLPIPIAPSSEQRRIVAKIEELFSDLDAGVAALKRVKAKLKRYRAAVLKAAVEGRLTEQWRAAHPATELASKLLERILTERRSKWEAEQLKAFARAGKNPPANWKDKYREPAGPDDSNLPPLSEGWCWARMRQVGAVQLGRQRSPKHHTGPHMRPYLRVANVFEDRIDTTDVMQMNFTPAEYETYRLKPGDVLLNEGQSLELIGRPAIYRDEVPGACFTNTLVRFQAHAGIDREFALAVFLTYLKNGRFQKIATITVNIAHLGAGRFAELEFPVPPLCEQRQIVAEINRQISLLNAIDATTDASLRRAARLRQSILKRAFEGKLVPQDPHDEPASVLLERIKTAAAASDTIKADCKSAAKRLRRFATTTTKEIEP